MTVLEPTTAMQLEMANQTKADFEWALNRLVSLLIEELGRDGAKVAQAVIEKLQEERARELARRNVQIAVDSTPLRE